MALAGTAGPGEMAIIGGSGRLGVGKVHGSPPVAAKFEKEEGLYLNTLSDDYPLSFASRRRRTCGLSGPFGITEFLEKIPNAKRRS